MDKNTVDLVISLIPVIQQLGKSISNSFDTDVEQMTLSETKEMLEQTRVENWPEFDFNSTREN
jgi:hypothetical protein